MLKGRWLVTALFGAVVVPGMLFAQEEGGPPRGGMRESGRMDGMRQNTIEWLLTQKDQFRPTGDQVAKLEEAAKQLTEAQAKRREELSKLREEAMNNSDDPRAGFEKMRPLMQELRKQDELATKEAVKVLNSEQAKVVEELLASRRKEMNARRGMGGPPGR
jgi:Spy/CpxP family protein refolding chaperone